VGFGALEREAAFPSDHNQGVFLPIKLDQSYDMARMVRKLKKFVALGNHDDE
jgi:hypothetical protein